MWTDGLLHLTWVTKREREREKERPGKQERRKEIDNVKLLAGNIDCLQWWNVSITAWARQVLSHTHTHIHTRIHAHTPLLCIYFCKLSFFNGFAERVIVRKCCCAFLTLLSGWWGSDGGALARVRQGSKNAVTLRTLRTLRCLAPFAVWHKEKERKDCAATATHPA